MVYLNQMKFINCLNKYKYFIIFLILGLLIFMYPLLGTKFDVLLGGYDNLYYNYVLEHSLLWIKGVHNSFWSAPFNYESMYSIAQVDSLFAYSPLFWIIRLFIKNPITAFQVLFIILCFLNYLTFYMLLKTIKLNDLACAFGAFIFAFSTLRFFNLDNIATFSQFLSIISLICILKINKNNKPIVNNIYFITCTLFLVLQFYTCFAIGYFFIFCLMFAVLFSLLPKNSRDIVISYIKEFYKQILFYSFAVFLSLIPMAYYFSVVNYVNPISKILSNIANYTIWIRSLSILDNIFHYRFEYVAQNANISSMSAGILTTFVAIYALFKTPKIKGFSLMTLLFIIFSCSGYSAIYFWRVFYYFSFGAESMESVNSVSFWVLVIIAFGIALFCNNVRNKVLLFAAILFVLTEQISYDKDLNSAVRYNFISKSNFINSINNIKVEDDIIKVIPKAINQNEYGKGDIELKNNTAQKIADLKALWLSLKENKPTLNNYMKKMNPINNHPAKNIVIFIDYNQI